MAEESQQEGKCEFEKSRQKVTRECQGTGDISSIQSQGDIQPAHPNATLFTDGPLYNLGAALLKADDSLKTGTVGGSRWILQRKCCARQR